MIGDVELGAYCSVWPSVVIRGDVNHIRIGAWSNVQDGSVIHVNGSPSHPTIIGERVTIGHGVMLHGCTIEDECLIGIGAIILNGAHIGRHSIIAAGALVREGQIIPEGSLVAGLPAQVKRPVNQQEKENFKKQALHYWYDLALVYLNQETAE